MIRQRRLSLEALEERCTPALSITISTAATFNVAVDDSVAGVRRFLPSGAGAILNVQQLRAALLPGVARDVVVSSTNGSNGNGDVIWNADADLDVDGITPGRTLTLQKQGNNNGSIIADADIFDSAGNNDRLAVMVQAGGQGGPITLTGAWSALRSASVNSKDDVTCSGALTADGALTLASQGNLSLSNTLATRGGAVLLDGNVSLTGALTLRTDLAASTSASDVTVNGTLAGGGHDLTIQAGSGDVALKGAATNLGSLLVGAASTALSKNLTFAAAATGIQLTGGVNVLANVTVDASGADTPVVFGGAITLSAGANLSVQTNGTQHLSLGGGTSVLGGSQLSCNAPLDVGAAATVSGPGTLSAPTVTVQGTLAPGGVGVAGMLTVTGDLVFANGGVLLVDLGLTSDQLQVTGPVTLQPGALLQGKGATVASAPVTLLTSSGALTGTFGNAPPGTLLLGADYVTVAYTAGPPGSLTVTPVAAGPNKVSFPTASGDVATLSLTGGGAARLVVVDSNNDGVLDVILVRASTALNSLTVTVSNNGGTGRVTAAQLNVAGPIAAVRAPGLDLSGNMVLSGRVGTLRLRTLGGGTAQLAGAGTIQALDVANFTLNSTAGLGTLLANRFDHVTLNAPTLTTLKALRNSDLGMAGDVRDCTFTLTSNFGLAKVGLGTLSAQGTVQNSTFRVQAGNVTSVVVGRFLGSRLYVGYTPAGSGLLEDAGTFTTANFFVRSFSTTALATALAPAAFADSQVVAAGLGTVRLTAVNLSNGGTTFGLRVKPGVASNAVSVRLAGTAPFIPLVNYKPSADGQVTPSVGGLAAQGDFRFFA